MHVKICTSGVAAFMAASGVSARLLPDLPYKTAVHDVLKDRQVTTTAELPTSTISQDPWWCITENITQYFDVPTPTGALLDGIDSYGYEVAAPCRATATGFAMVSCTVSDPKSWCGFSTAAPSDLLISYSTYLSAVVSFCTEKSSTMSILSTSCPVAWQRPDLIKQEWLKIAMAHAQCYLEADVKTETSAQITAAPSTSTTPSASASQSSMTPTSASTSTSTSTNMAVLHDSSALALFALTSTGFVILVNSV